MAEFLLGVVCGGIIASGFWIVHSERIQRSMASSLTLDFRIREYRHMRNRSRKPAGQGGNQPWWEDG